MQIPKVPSNWGGTVESPPEDKATRLENCRGLLRRWPFGLGLNWWGWDIRRNGISGGTVPQGRDWMELVM